MALVVPANSYHPVTITAQAREAGTLTIRGCFAQAPGGASREFLLPLSTDDEENRQSRRRSAIDCETGRSKHAGLSSRPWEKKGKRMSVPAASSSTRSTLRFLQCQVVMEQPLLRIRRTSLTHGAVMLYNGERQVRCLVYVAMPERCSQIDYPDNSRECFLIACGLCPAHLRGLYSWPRSASPRRRRALRLRHVRNRIRSHPQASFYMGQFT